LESDPETVARYCLTAPATVAEGKPTNDPYNPALCSNPGNKFCVEKGCYCPPSTPTTREGAREKSWIDNLVGTFDDNPNYAQVIANEKQARQWMEEGRCASCGSFPPTGATPLAVEAAAREIAQLPSRNAYGNDESHVSAITVIISRHCADAGEVDRLREQFELLDDPDGLYTEARAKIEATARANAIRDAKTAVYPVLVAHYNDCTNSVRGQQLHAAVVAALESLAKGEEDDGLAGIR
jgi:hypothetical protein